MKRKGPSLLFRCVLALLLMTGFYILAVAVAGTLFYLPYAEYTVARRVHIRLALICIGSGFAILASVLPRRDKFEPPGPELTPGKHPKLFRELQRIASAMRQSMPEHVYLTAEVNAWVSHRGGIMGIGSRRVMGLGLPLLKILSVSELRAVLAHEFGHYQGGDTALAPWVYKTRMAITRTLDNLGSGIIRLPFVLYARGFLRITHAVSRQEEYAADARAAQLAGVRPLITSLQKIHWATIAFDAYWKTELAPVLSAGFRPPIADGFSAFLSSEPIANGTVAVLEEELNNSSHDPYDTHPSLSERIQALGEDRHPVRDDGTDAITLLDFSPAIEGEMLQVLYGPQAPESFREIEWKDTLSLVYVPAWLEQTKPHVEALTGICFKTLPEVMKQLFQIAARFKIRLGAHVSDKNKNPAVAAIIGAALAVVLTDRGFPTTCELGSPIRVKIGDTDMLPLSIPSDLSTGKMTGETWLELCESAGLSEVDLGEAIREIVQRREESRVE